LEDEDRSMATLARIWKQNRDAKKSWKRKWDELNEARRIR
jgi:hypothetical protein